MVAEHPSLSLCSELLLPGHLRECCTACMEKAETCLQPLSDFQILPANISLIYIYIYIHKYLDICVYIYIKIYYFIDNKTTWLRCILNIFQNCNKLICTYCNFKNLCQFGLWRKWIIKIFWFSKVVKIYPLIQ